MAETDATRADTQAVLFQARLFWGAMVAAPLMFFGVALFVTSTGDGPVAQPTADAPEALDITMLLSAINALMYAVSVPAGFLVRSLIFKKSTRNGAVSPAGYFVGNLIFLALIQGQTLFAGVIFLISGSMIPVGLFLLGMVLLALGFPTGSAMRPAGRSSEDVFPAA